MSQQNKVKRVGRPKLPKGEAKGRIVPVRFTGDDLKTMAAAAKASKQTLSEWIWCSRHDSEDLSRLVENLCQRRSSIRDLISAFRNSTRNPFPNWVGN